MKELDSPFLGNLRSLFRPEGWEQPKSHVTQSMKSVPRKLMLKICDNYKKFTTGGAMPQMYLKRPMSLQKQMGGKTLEVQLNAYSKEGK